MSEYMLLEDSNHVLAIEGVVSEAGQLMLSTDAAALWPLDYRPKTAARRWIMEIGVVISIRAQ
jgi:hypothetical protein